MLFSEPRRCLDYTQTILNWFDYALKGVNNEYAIGSAGAPFRHGRKRLAR